MATNDDDVETVTFYFPTIIQLGKGHLSVEFSGKFANDMLGLYRSSYTDKSGKEHNILATQFEPEIACVVVPKLKGCSEPPDGHNYVKITFDCIPIMVTYITAIVLLGFEYISTTVPNNNISNACSANSLPKRIEIRVYAPLGMRNFGQHALAVAKKSPAFGKFSPVSTSSAMVTPKTRV
ncbi:unnamed protein product [Taenia asiatica]|uniref:Peptidase_M1_N domain-containing protein n=1 Tax=Taenia asiatica TaxID=60517 RepID=A0A0R3WFU5_TAEAS|nr:unnamed protein product [Taenia asiatica]